MTGCHDFVEMDFVDEKVVFSLQPAAVLSGFSKEVKTIISIKDDIDNLLLQKVIYYCNQSAKCSQIVEIECN